MSCRRDVCCCDWADCEELQNELLIKSQVDTTVKPLVGYIRIRFKPCELHSTETSSLKKKQLIESFVRHVGMHRSRLSVFDHQKSEESKKEIQFPIAKHHFHRTINTSSTNITTPLPKDEAFAIGISHYSDRSICAGITYMKVPNVVRRTVLSYLTIADDDSSFLTNRRNTSRSRNMLVTPSMSSESLKVAASMSTPTNHLLAPQVEQFSPPMGMPIPSEQIFSPSLTMPPPPVHFKPCVGIFHPVLQVYTQSSDTIDVRCLNN
jgi:hypothetical protein